MRSSILETFLLSCFSLTLVAVLSLKPEGLIILFLTLKSIILIASSILELQKFSDLELYFSAPIIRLEETPDRWCLFKRGISSFSDDQFKYPDFKDESK